MAKKKDIPVYPAFPGKGVLTRDDDPSFAQAIRGAYSTPDNLVVEHPGSDPVNYPSKRITRDSKTDRLSFISADTSYRIRELREDDGAWLSKYKTLLPLDALDAIVGTSTLGENVATPDDDLDGPDESLEAYSLEDSVYVVGLVYTNGSGRWARVDGSWSLLSPSDETYSGSNILATPIDPERADEFLRLYDENYVSITDAERFAYHDDDEPDFDEFESAPDSTDK